MRSYIDVEISYYVHKHCPLDWRVETKHFLSFGLLLILDGSVHYVIDDRDYDVCAGMMLHFRPGCSRRGTTSTGVTIIAIDFSLLDNTHLGFPEIAEFTMNDELEKLLNSLEDEWKNRQESYMQRCNAILSLILQHLSKGISITRYNPYVERIKRYISENYSKHISVRELAELVGLNATYCGALFHRIQGITIAEYVNQIRIRKACYLLEKKELQVSEIADLCGFCDIYYFSATFKRLMGVSPSTYSAHRNRL